MSKKIIRDGFVIAVTMIAINFILNFLISTVYPASQKIYENTTIFRSMTAPLSTLFFLYPFILAFAFAFIWDKSKKLFKDKSVCKRGFKFSLVYLFVAVIPMFLINFSSFNLPFWIVSTWSIMSYLNGLVSGLILAKLNK